MESNIQDSAVLHAILEAAVDAIVVADEDGTILRANPAACRMFQHDADVITGSSVNMLMPTEMAHKHDGFMRRHLQTGEMRVIGKGRDLEGVRGDGSTFPLHISVGETEVSGQHLFVGILHDLTLRNATNDALSRSQRLDAIGQMTGGIAHDFNNLLTVVIGNLELLQMRGANDRMMPLIRDALTSAELGAELTSRLMVFARRSDLLPIEADLRDLCEETLAMLRRILGSGIEIRTDFADNLNLIMIDPVQLQSALVNLVLNARDAMKSGGELLIAIADVVIDDTYMAQETDIDPGRYVRLSVSDNGDGMTQSAQKRAFEPFFTTKGESGGSGLGLAMVYGFVRQSGGHITIYSEPGLGTSFGLYFPVVAAPKKAEAVQQSAKEPQMVRNVSGLTVLIVEDNPKVRKLSVKRIQDLGFRIEQAASGDAAYELLKSGVHADIVFSDLVMPGKLNGYDLAARISEEFPDIRILLTSGYASDVVTSSMARGARHEILHKPYRQTDLAKRLQALCRDPSGDGTF